MILTDQVLRGKKLLRAMTGSRVELFCVTVIGRPRRGYKCRKPTVDGSSSMRDVCVSFQSRKAARIVLVRWALRWKEIE